MIDEQVKKDCLTERYITKALEKELHNVNIHHVDLIISFTFLHIKKRQLSKNGCIYKESFCCLK
jgi:hypothetical protein